MEAPAAAPYLVFPVLDGAPVRAAITLRVPGLPVSTDRSATMALLGEPIRRRVEALAPGLPMVTAGQTHGVEVAVVDPGTPSPVPVVDGLLTHSQDLVLAIAIADCCPVWLWTGDGAAHALVHAGRRGAEGGIASVAAGMLMERTGTPASGIHAFLGPCIRPPNYEVDVPAMVHAQLAEMGIKNRLDCGLDTASDLARFYSYRVEKGCTGRMMALAWMGEGAAGCKG